MPRKLMGRGARRLLKQTVRTAAKSTRAAMETVGAVTTAVYAPRTARGTARKLRRNLKTKGYTVGKR